MQKDRLPAWSEKILRVICPEHLAEEIEGDLVERYNLLSTKMGGIRRNAWLLSTILKYLRPGIFLRHKFHTVLEGHTLYKNYLTASLRHVSRHKLNALFKTMSLAAAMFGVLVVVLYVGFHLSFDKYHQDYERIYRVNTQRRENGNVEQFGIAPVAMGEMLAKNFPELESFARIDIANGSHIHYKDKIVFAGVFSADSTLFDIFSYKFLAGDRRALTHPSGIVLTETIARKVFGSSDPLHKLITINKDPKLYEVTAVIQDIPNNSHIRVDAFVPLTRHATFGANQVISPPDFVDNSCILFVKLRSNRDKEKLVSKVDRVLDQYVDKKTREQNAFAIFLQPLPDIYLDPPLKYEFTRKGSMTYVYLFLVLGAFLLVIGSVNYINLSISDFLSRSKEMNIRKVIGSTAQQVTIHLVLEASLYCVVSAMLAVGAIYVFLPQIKHYIEPQIDINVLWSPKIILLVAGILTLLIVTTGLVPARPFFKRNVAAGLKSDSGTIGGVNMNRSILLAQFVISVICIVATLTIGRQIHYIHEKDLGIDRNDLLVLTMAEDFSVENMLTFKSSLKQLPGVVHVSNSSFRMGGGFWKDWYQVEVNGEMKDIELYEVFSDDELFETLKIKILQGRTFDGEHKLDSGKAFVVNETAVRVLGLKDPVGTRIGTHPEEPGKWQGTIVGVVNDVNISTLHKPVQPLVMRLPWQSDYPEYFVYVRFAGDVSKTIAAIKEAYQQLQPGYPLEVHFVDSFYNREYENETRAFTTLQFATGIVIIVSGMGVFSLAMFFSLRKMKEFGIRKILGASTWNIAGLHLSYFIKTCSIAFALAIPLAYSMMQQWLNAFAYRIEQSAATYIFVGGMTILIGTATAGYAAMRSALENPVETIRKV